jgi:hypothetical protein
MHPTDDGQGSQGDHLSSGRCLLRHGHTLLLRIVRHRQAFALDDRPARLRKRDDRAKIHALVALSGLREHINIHPGIHAPIGSCGRESGEPRLVMAELDFEKLGDEDLVRRFQGRLAPDAAENLLEHIADCELCLETADETLGWS